MATQLTKAMRKKLLKRDSHMCVICCARNELCVDHIIPSSLGGTNEESNLQILCRRCNSEKGSRPLDDMPRYGQMCMDREFIENLFADLKYCDYDNNQTDVHLMGTT
jgi:hypothetical protein